MDLAGTGGEAADTGVSVVQVGWIQLVQKVKQLTLECRRCRWDGSCLYRLGKVVTCCALLRMVLVGGAKHGRC